MSGTLTFTPGGCPVFEHGGAVVWPAAYTSIVKANGEQVVVTADGRKIAAGDGVSAGGGSVPRSPAEASGAADCLPGNADLFYIESTVHIGHSR